MNFPWLSKVAGQPVPSVPTAQDMFLARFYDLEKDRFVSRMRTEMGRGARKRVQALEAEGILATQDVPADMLMLTSKGVREARRAAIRVKTLADMRKRFERRLGTTPVETPDEPDLF